MTGSNMNTGNMNTGSMNTGNMNTGNSNTGNSNTGDWNTGNMNAGDWNAGNWNAGNWNAGFFNTTTPTKIMVFNDDCEREDWDAAIKPSWLYAPACNAWIASSEMTPEEQAANPMHESTGGYLRANDMREEWRAALSGASNEDIQAVRDLPNFDYDVFEEITGLNLREETTATCDGKTVVIDGVEYELREKKQ